MKDAVLDVILGELGDTLRVLDEEEFDRLVNELLVPHRRVLVMAVGRMLISLKAWVKRMKHLNIDINYVGDETELPVKPGDLVLCASSSGESKLPVAIAQIAKQLDITLGYIGCTQGSTIDSLADFHVMLKGPSKNSAADEHKSKQPMTTLVEQQLYLLGDMIALEIMDRRNWGENDIKDRHANLE